MKRNYLIYLDTGSGYGLIPSDCIKQMQPVDFSRDKDQMYYRLKIGEITFQNIPSFKIYDLINGCDFTTEIKVKIVYYGITIEGYFSMIDCIFDFDSNAKIVKAKPAIHDKYRRFLENYETEVDISHAYLPRFTSTAHVTSTNVQTFEFWGRLNSNGPGSLRIQENSPGFVDYVGVGVVGFDDYTTGNPCDFRDFFSGSAPNITLLKNLAIVDNNLLSIQDVIDTMALSKYELSELTIWISAKAYDTWSGKNYRWINVTCKFSQEQKFTFTSDKTETGITVPPSGDGWELASPTPVFDERELGGWGYVYHRIPFNGDYSSNWSKSSTEINTSTGGTTGFAWLNKCETKITYPVTTENNGNFDLRSLSTLKDLLTYIYRQLHTDLSTKEVKSLFFFNDDEGDYLFMSGKEGTNYVTNEMNELNYLDWFNVFGLKTTINESTSSDDSTLPVMFKNILEDIKVLFPVFYFVDADQNLHIEHVKYFDITLSTIDISTKKEIGMTFQYEFDTSVLFDLKTFKQMNSGYLDFTGNTLKFEQAVSNNRNKDNKSEVTTQIFTTDLTYCLENPNNLAKGLCLVLSKNGNVLNDIGLLTGREQLNGALSLSQLLTKYWVYEGVWIDGKINDSNYMFLNPYRSKVGIDLQFRGILPNMFYTTQIGVGLLDNGSLDLDNAITKIKLRYRYNSNGIGDQSEFLVAKINEPYDFENYYIQSGELIDVTPENSTYGALVQKRIYELATTFTPSSIADISNIYFAIDKMGWDEANKLPFSTLITNFFPTLKSLSEIKGYAEISPESTRVTFPSPLDDLSGKVIIVGAPKGLADNASIDYVISNADRFGFDCIVWESAYINYTAGWDGASLPLSSIPVPVAGISSLNSGVNTITIPEHVNTNYNPICQVYSADNTPVAMEIDYNSLTVTTFQIWVNVACFCRWTIFKHT